MKYVFCKRADMGADFVLAMHTYIPEWNVVLIKFYRNPVKMVNGIINNKVLYVCVSNIRMSYKLARI